MRLRKKLALAVLVCAASASAHAQRLPSGVGEHEVDLWARLLAMTDTRQLDTAVVGRALASKWRPLRAAGALAIGQIGAERGASGAPLLRALLKDADASVAGNAAYALGLLRDTASISDLSRALTGNGEVARESAWALGEIGAPSRAAISNGLKSQADTGTAIQLLLAAAKLRPVPLADLTPYLRSAHPSVVWAATYAIARTRAPAGVRDLLDLEASPALNERPRNRPRSLGAAAPYVDASTGYERARAEIARGLAKSAAGDSLGTKAFAVLSRLVGDVDAHVRVNAIRSLGTYGPIARAALIYAAHDQDPNVRIAAAQSFGTVLKPDATEMPALWAADTSLVYRSSLLTSAVRAGLRPAELAQWAASPDWRLRAAVASAVGDSLDRAFVMSRAVPLTADPDPRVREAAYAVLTPPA